MIELPGPAVGSCIFLTHRAGRRASWGVARFFHPLKPLLLGWLMSLIVWGLVACLLGSEAMGRQLDFWSVAVKNGIRDWAMWAFLSPPIFRFVSRFPIERQRWFVAWPAHLAVFFAAMLAVQGWKQGVDWGYGKISGRTVGPGFAPPGPPPGQRISPPPFAGAMPPPPPQPGARPAIDLFRSFSFDVPIYLALLSLAHIAIYRRRLQERGHSLTRARLDALRIQLQPHFLFNTLNTIAGLVYEQPAKADAMLVALGDLLRISLETSSAAEIPLHREVEYVERYLAIMLARFEGRIGYVIDVENGAREGLVPAFMLQPLVENSVQHGLQPRPEGGIVTLTARRDGGKLRLVVADDGVGFRHRADATEGIGLGNARARLAELYGSGASLEMYDGPRTEIIIELPFRVAS